MRCTNCGASRSEGPGPCPSCGAPGPGGGGALVGTMGLRRCPSCGFRGDPTSYFSRSGHLGILIVASIFTYGIAGLVYWLVKHRARICPGCGLDWGRTVPLGTLPPATSGGEGSELQRWERSSLPAGSPPAESEGGLPAAGGFRRVSGWLLILLATLFAVLGIVEWAAPPLIAAAFTGGTGALALWSGMEARRQRRRALMDRLQQQVLHLARQRNGRLTVSEVATDLELSLPAAERLLLSMDDGFRVRSDVTDEGLLVFEFPEFQHRELRG